MGGTIPLMSLVILHFDEIPLWVLIYFLGAIGTWKRLFGGRIGLDATEILSVDSDLNENTSL